MTGKPKVAVDQVWIYPADDYMVVVEEIPGNGSVRVKSQTHGERSQTHIFNLDEFARDYEYLGESSEL